MFACDMDPVIHLSLMCLILILLGTDDINQAQILSHEDWGEILFKSLRIVLISLNFRHLHPS